jgi:predicted transcriptional regulator YdeE
MAKAAKAKKAPKRKPAGRAAKPKKPARAAKRSSSKAAPKRKMAKKATRATKAKAAPKRKVAKKSAPAAKAKAAPRRKPVAAKRPVAARPAPKPKTAAPAPKPQVVAKPQPAAKPHPAAAPAAPAAASLSVRFADGRAFTIAGMGGRYTPATNRDIPALWQQFGPRWFGQVPGQVGRKAYGVCYNFDDQGNLDYVAAVEVDAASPAPAELTQMSIPAGRYAVFEHSDHVANIGKTWMEIFSKWLPGSGKRVANSPSFELYHETFDPAVGVGGIEIWIPIEE